MTKELISVVTGGAGFIGSHMVDLLIESGHKVRVIDNLSGGHKENLAHISNDAPLECFWEDINGLEPDSPIFRDVDYVFHFAGIGDIVPSIEQPIDYMQTNVMGTTRVLECARAVNIKRFVYAASSSCYGLAATPTGEDHAIDPQYPYALSKYFGEQSAFHWHRVYGLPVTSVRIFNAYGTRVRTTGAYGAVFGVFFRQKLSGHPFTVVGDGTQVRDFVYASDVARAFLMAAKSDAVGEFFNLGAGNPQPVNKLVELLGGDVIYIPKRPGEPDATFADITKIKTLLGWQPMVSFEDGVARMVAEIDRWQNAPLWTPETISDATKTWFKYLGNE
ncbi:GDP-mannose 4,6-dehydratase [Rhodospirillales bacterium]|nr:GDP-mannose 4,6-dehydratase [Rhodospirillales bacterium]